MSKTAQRSASESEDVEKSTSWDDSPWIAFGIRTAVFLVPVLLSLGVTWFLASKWSPPTTVPGAFGRFFVLAVIALVVVGVADKGARKFLPLAALFRLSLVFPDQAPSRFSIALRSGNTKRLEQRLLASEDEEWEGTAAEAAQLVVEMAAQLSEHDRLTRGHSERVRAFTALIADEMKLSPEDSNKLQWAGLIHDVGKLRIDQAILTKPGRLTKEEFDIIKTHPEEGMRLAAPLAEYLGEWIGAVGEHHERYDGGGYPNGLAGTDISLAGRIVSVADAYDVITAARSYKKPLSPEFARQELAENAGTQFDPEVVRAFLNISLGRLRRAMWPLSWAAQLPYLGTAVTTPIAQTVAAAAVTLATAAGVTVVADSIQAPASVPDAIALVDEAQDEIPDEPSLVTTTTTNAVGADTPATAVVVTTAAPQLTDTTPLAEVTTTTEAPGAAPGNQTASTAPTTVVVPQTTTATAAPRTTTTTAAPRTTTTTAAPRTTTTTPAPTTTKPPLSCTAARQGNGQQQGANLRNCDLTGVTLTNADFTGANLTGATLSDTMISGGSFKNAILDNATIGNSGIWAADFTGASFVNASIVNTGFHSTNTSGTNFTRATLTNVGLTGNTTNANFSKATLTGVGFEGADLTDANMTQAEIRETNFRYTTLTRLNLNGARLTDIDTWGASGTPSNHELAQFIRVNCPNGTYGDTSCW